MNSYRFFLLAFGTLLLFWCLDAGINAQGDRAGLEDATVLPEGLDVLTRGPVHEAYAQPVLRDPEAAPVVREKPPEPVPELPPEMKPEGDNVVWIPGYWAFDGEAEQFLWVSGLWRNLPPDRTWIPGYWYRVEAGYQWVSGYWSVEEADVVILPPPPEPIAEAVPPAPDAESAFIPGCWVHVERRYYWRPGHWVQYRPGWAWTPACYYWTPAGHVFVDGYWDHDFQRRGLLFAPVRFTNAAVYGRPGFFYRPRHVVYADFLVGSLFVRGGGHRAYYFGDYYGPRYARAGFVPWVNVRLGGGRYYDPLFSYYRWNNRNQPRWEANLRTVYEGRRDGTLARPPRTFGEQMKFAATTKNAFQVAVPLERYKVVEKTDVRLTSVSKTEITRVTKRIEEIQTLRTVRSQNEEKIRVKGGAKSEAVRMELPRLREDRIAAKGEAAPPPRPTVPKAFTRPFEGKSGAPKGKDKLDPTPKGKDKFDPTPKGKDQFDPTPKGKDIDSPRAKEPKGKGKRIRDRDDVPPPKQIVPPATDPVPPKPPVNVRPKTPPELPIPKSVLPDPPRPPRVKTPDPSNPTPAAPPKGKGGKKDRQKEDAPASVESFRALAISIAAWTGPSRWRLC